MFIPLGFQKCPWTGKRRNKHKRLLRLGIWNLDLIKSKRYYKLGEEIIAGGKMTYLMRENHFGFLSHNMGCPGGSDGKKICLQRDRKISWRREWQLHSSWSTGNWNTGNSSIPCTVPWTEDLGRFRSPQYMQISTLSGLIKIWIFFLTLDGKGFLKLPKA